VPLFIDHKLQAEIRFLCKEVWTDEWSGMLFYETEGDFGEDNFKIVAKSLFLLDIGSQAYTEYDPADPELIKFLGSNPDVLMMKKGHIHSHNNMAVFFSGTDDGELVDNCGFHNFYLSLIVNNKNDMCAKIAFKAKATSENHTTITYLNQEGKEKHRKMMSKKEDDCIYVYKCEIIKPTEAVEDTFKSRFQELKEQKETKEKARKTFETAHKNGTYKGFNVDERWRQAGLFDDVKGSTQHPKGGKDERFTRGDARETVGSGTKRVSVVERVGSIRTDPRVYTMLSKLLSMDFLYEGTLSTVMRKLDNEFFPDPETDVEYGGLYPLHLFCDAVELKATEYYIDSFPEDSHRLLNFEATMEKCVEILETYDDDYPELVTHLTEALNLEIK